MGDTYHANGEPAGAVNTVMVERYCRVSRMQNRIWVCKVYDQELDKVVDQIQYEQISDFEFGYHPDGRIIVWPHIQVNTLRRLEDIPRRRRFPSIVLPIENKASAGSDSD